MSFCFIAALKVFFNISPNVVLYVANVCKRFGFELIPTSGTIGAGDEGQVLHGQIKVTGFLIP